MRTQTSRNKDWQGVGSGPRKVEQNSGATNTVKPTLTSQFAAGIVLSFLVTQPSKSYCTGQPNGSLRPLHLLESPRSHLDLEQCSIGSWKDA